MRETLYLFLGISAVIGSYWYFHSAPSSVPVAPAVIETPKSMTQDTSPLKAEHSRKSPVHGKGDPLPNLFGATSKKSKVRFGVPLDGYLHREKNKSLLSEVPEPTEEQLTVYIGCMEVEHKNLRPTDQSKCNQLFQGLSFKDSNPLIRQ